MLPTRKPVFVGSYLHDIWWALGAVKRKGKTHGMIKNDENDC